MANTVCALPGCPNLVSDAEAAFRRGFCQQHVGEAIIDVAYNLGGHLEQLTEQIDSLRRELRERPDPDS